MRRFLLLLLMLFPFCCFSQIAADKYLFLNYGVSLPQGDYASSTNAASSGYALRGPFYAVHFIWDRSYKIGFDLSISRSDNPFNVSSIQSYLNSSGTGIPLQVSVSDWQVTNYLIGIHVPLEYGENYTVGLKLQAGISNTVFPVEDIISNGTGIVASSPNANSLLLNAGCVANLRIYKNIFLNLSLEAMYTNPIQKSITIGSTNPNIAGSLSQSLNETQNITIINVSAGVGLKF